MPIPSKRLLHVLDSDNKMHQKFALSIILAIYFFGLLGLSYPLTRPYFEVATPLSLFFTSVLLFLFHRDWNSAFVSFAVFTSVFGFLVEVLGVRTTYIFGNYTYGPTLGTKLWDVPLIIGLNWLLLTYVCGSISEKFTSSIFINSISGSVMMVLLDFLIEPVAIKLDFWRWQDGYIPFQNYVGWFISAFILQFVFHYLKFDKKNILAKYVLFVQAIFFIILQFII